MNSQIATPHTNASDHRWIALALLCTAQLLVILDATS
jgi:hypothetical protein